MSEFRVLVADVSCSKILTLAPPDEAHNARSLSKKKKRVKGWAGEEAITDVPSGSYVSLVDGMRGSSVLLIRTHRAYSRAYVWIIANDALNAIIG